MDWISVKEKLPNDFDEHGTTKSYLVFIDNPFFQDGNYHVARFQKNTWGEEFNYWCGIESNVAHGKNPPNVTHWMPLPEHPLK